MTTDYQGRHRRSRPSPKEPSAESEPDASSQVATRERPAGGSGSSANVDRMARGGGLNLLGAVLQQGCLFAIVAFLAHSLGKEDVGRYAVCFGLFSLLALLAMAGFRAGLTRYTAMHLADNDPSRARGTLRLGLGVTTGASFLLGALLALLAPQVAGVMNDPSLEVGIRWVALALPAHAISEAALAATQGWRSQRAYTVIGRIFDPAARLVLTVLLVLLGTGYAGAVAAIAAAAWATAALALIALARRVRGIPRAPAVYQIREVFTFSMVSWVAALAATGLIWAGTLMLGALTDPGQVGVYNVATRLVGLAVFVLPPITATFSPHMAHLHHVGDRAEAARAFGNATRWSLLLSMPAFVMLIVFPGPLLQLFGPEFVDGAVVTIVLACGQLVAAAVGPSGVVLNMSGRVGLSLLDNGLILVANIALNFLLIPSMGILGAALAWSISLIVVNLVKVAQARWVVGIRADGAATGRIALAGLCAAAGALLVRRFVEDWFVQILAGGVVVAAIYLTFLALARPHPDDLRVLRGMTRRVGLRTRRA